MLSEQNKRALQLMRLATELTEEVKRSELIVCCAENLVGLWNNQNIQGLPRAERNAAIDGCRQELIDTVGGKHSENQWS